MAKTKIPRAKILPLPRRRLVPVELPSPIEVQAAVLKLPVNIIVGMRQVVAIADSPGGGDINRTKYDAAAVVLRIMGHIRVKGEK